MEMPTYKRYYRFVFSKGFTLIELMMVLAMSTVLLSLAIPQYNSTLHSVRVQNETKRFLGALRIARSEAVMRNSVVSVCPSDMALTGLPRCTGTYSQGWIVFENQDKDPEVEGGVSDVLEVFAPLYEGYQFRNRRGTREAGSLINYLPDGSAHRNQTLQLCTPPGSEVSAASIVLNIVGRARLIKEWGTCPHLA